MKDSTAKKKLDRVMIATGEYTKDLYSHPDNALRIQELKCYAKQLIIRKRIDPRPYRRLFFREEFQKLIKLKGYA